MTSGARPGRGPAGRRRWALVALAAAAAIVTVEAALVAPGHLLAAQVVDAVLLLLLVNTGRLRERDGDRPLVPGRAALPALALVPLLRVLGLALPLDDLGEPAAVLLVATSVAGVAMRVASLVHLPLSWRGAGGGRGPGRRAVVAGGVLGVVAYLAGAPRLWPEGAGGGHIALALLAAATAAAVEELVFRGLVQGALQRALGRTGVAVAIAIFAATYLGSSPVDVVLAVVLSGVIFAHVFARTGTLACVVLGHVLLAVGAGGVWPVLLDGLDLPSLAGPGTTAVLSVAVAAAVVAAVAPRLPGTPSPAA